MIFRVLIIFFILNFCNPALASIKDGIISQIQLTNNLSFNFIQTVGDKIEKGKCIIEYQKKIWCKYNNSNKKIIVSNGRTLVIKTINKNSYYLYPLKKTPLEFLLDKEYLISKIKTLEAREIDDKYLNFTFLENSKKINIFFDMEDLNLVGWQTEDIYQNLTITFISSIKINQKLNNSLFILPSKD
ncbi:outer-membrane lipoprotein carrier protein LolA [Candidatus Pelagibacter sp.]|nr:outer-membrane lipoprotein carrier protein LolA [Candidatus Pelagibacter sp.]